MPTFDIGAPPPNDILGDAKRLRSEQHLSPPERPIQFASDDRLERSAFVRHLTSALIDPTTGRSRGIVVGITGPWGSGKSSILNLLRESLKTAHPDAIVVSFDPWLVSGRNDLISEFISELLATINSQPKTLEKLKGLSDTITKYGEQLAPLGNLLVPGAGTVIGGGLAILKAVRSKDVSLSALRRQLLTELTNAAVPIVVLIDEVDRLEDDEIRTVAQLVRSVVDFPGISYVLAYDHGRVVQALGGDAADEERYGRGRAYLEKIVQLQIPLPITLSDEIIRLLVAELFPLRQELHIPAEFQDLPRYKALMKILSSHVIETPRDVKRLIGTFHVFAGMLDQEVDWIDLLAYSALLIKAPATVDKIRADPDSFCADSLSVLAAAERVAAKKTSLSERLAKLIAEEEDSDGIQNLVGFLFPSFSDQSERSSEHADALCLRRPLLTTLRLGLLPGAYSRADIRTLVSSKPEEVAQLLRVAFDNGSLGQILDRLDDLYREPFDINHVELWRGIGIFVRKPNCEWMAAFQPIHDVVQNFERILLGAVGRTKGFDKIALKIFDSLREDGEDVVTTSLIRAHVFMHGLFGRENRSDRSAFLDIAQTESAAREICEQFHSKHLAGALIPCHWDLQPAYLMMDVGVWDASCRAKLDEALVTDRALDGLTLMLYGPFFITSKETLDKLFTYETYLDRVRTRLSSPTIGEVDSSIRAALDRAARGGW